MRDPDVPPKSRRPVRASALALVAVTGGLFLRWREHQAPERLVEFPRASLSAPAGVVGEELFLRHNAFDRHSMEVRAMPLRGGAERPVFRVENVGNILFEWDLRRMDFTRKGIYFRTSHPLDGDRPPPLLIGPQPPPTQRTWPRRARVHLWHVPLAGGTPRELFPERPAYGVMVVGDYCYWLESELLGPGKPLVTRIDDRPKQKLRVAPLSGGAARTIAELPLDARVMPGTRGVFWAVSSGQQSDLVYTRPPDFSVAVIPGVYGFEAPREVGDRLYWVDGAEKGDEQGAKRPHQLISTAVDGSDRRVELDVAKQSSGDPRIYGLVDDGSTLLVERTRTLSSQGDSILKSQHTLCYFHLGSKELRPLVHWPEGNSSPTLMLDGGFAYYATGERRENWLDWSAKGLSPRPVLQLSRVRVPR